MTFWKIINKKNSDTVTDKSIREWRKENNEYYEASDATKENYIDVKIGNNSVLKETETSLINKYVNQNNGALTKFSCSGIQYYDSGRIKSISFIPLK